MSGSYSGQGPVGDKRRARELGFGMSPGAGAGTGNGGTGTRLGLGRRYSCSVACTSPSWADTDAPPPAHLSSIAVRLPHRSLPRFRVLVQGHTLGTNRVYAMSIASAGGIIRSSIRLGRGVVP